MYRLIVIGNGIAGNLLVEELLTGQNTFKTDEICQVSTLSLAIPCSHRTTGIVARRGVEKGLSDLGDDLFQAWEMAQAFLTKNIFSSVTRSSLYTIDNQESEKNQRRYNFLEPSLHWPLPFDFPSHKKVYHEDCFLLRAESFLQQLEDRHKIVRYQTLLKRISKKNGFYELDFQNGERVSAEKIVLCTNAYAPWFSTLWPSHSLLEKMKTVQGAYLEGTQNLGPDSFTLSLDDLNIIYHHENQKVMIGSTSDKNQHLITNQKKMAGWQETLEKGLSFTFHLTDYKLKIGQRTLFKDRRAHVVEIDEGFWQIAGLYKNGFSLGFLTAKRAKEKILSLPVEG